MQRQLAKPQDPKLKGSVSEGESMVLVLQGLLWAAVSRSGLMQSNAMTLLKGTLTHT
jgi:hypothetical protein